MPICSFISYYVSLIKNLISIINRFTSSEFIYKDIPIHSTRTHTHGRCDTDFYNHVSRQVRVAQRRKAKLRYGVAYNWPTKKKQVYYAVARLSEFREG